MKTPQFYILRYSGYSDLDNPDYEWFISTSEKQAIKDLKEMYPDYELADIEVYTISGNEFGCNGKQYKVVLQEIKA
jgi:hypothetical protein